MKAVMLSEYITEVKILTASTLQRVISSLFCYKFYPSFTGKHSESTHCHVCNEKI